jgi:hypothetical protein
VEIPGSHRKLTMFNSQFSKKYILLVVLFLVSFLERVIFDFGPNVELITMSIIVSSIFLGKKHSFWLTFLIIAVTDRVIGNSRIFMFTWSGFLVPAYFVGMLSENIVSIRNSRLFRLVFGTGLGLGTSLFFFLWTNFGVWALDAWGMYANNLSGLMQSYVNALPFFRANLISTIVFVPLGIIASEVYFKIVKNISTRNLLKYAV